MTAFLLVFVISFLGLPDVVHADSLADVSFYAMAVKSFAGLGVCLGFFCIMVYFLKRNQKALNADDAPMKVIARRTLTSKTSLVLVEVRGKEMVLTVGTENVDVVPLEDTSAASEGKPNLFPIREVMVD